MNTIPSNGSTVVAGTNGTSLRRKHQLRSEEVQDILSRPPSWIVRWGTGTFMLFFCLLLSIAFVLPSQEVVSASVRVQREAGGYVAMASLAQTSFEKIHVGQRVEIRLQAFPGVIMGWVVSVGNQFNAADGSFLVTVGLSDVRSIPLTDNLLGMGDFIVSQKRLIQKLSPF